MDGTAGPKMDFKMLAMPAMLLLSRNIDFKNENIVKMAQIGLVSVAVIILSLHFFVYNQVKNKKNEKKIWVPPKPKPSLPFGLGPPAEPVKAEDFEATTYTAHEIKLLKDSVQSIAMSLGISIFMSLKFSIHMSLVMQAITIPMNCMDMIVLKKYILGTTKAADGGDKLYGELFEPPTAATLAALNPAPLPVDDKDDKGPLGENDVRVEELPDEPKGKAAGGEKTKPSKTKAATKVADENTAPENDSPTEEEEEEFVSLTKTSEESNRTSSSSSSSKGKEKKPKHPVTSAPHEID